MRHSLRRTGVLLAALLLPLARAQAGADAIKIGVLGDRSGMASDSGGEGTVEAVRMAVADFGAATGRPVTVVSADTLNKPDTASAIARRWFDDEGVDVIVELPVSSVGLAVQQVARERKRILLNTATAAAEITGKLCSPYTVAWADDTVALARSTARAAAGVGAKRWFFVSADYAFGHAMERDAAAVIEQGGGTVAGAVRHPLNTQDFSSYLIAAQSSGADAVGLANFGTDLTTAIKQAHEFGLGQGGQKLVAFDMFINDAASLGLDAAQGLILSEDFYWDDNDATRAWSKRFFDARKQMPSRDQASAYAGVAHYLKAVQAAGTTDADAVMAKMRAMPADHFGKPVQVRGDGRVMLDMNIYQVKAPAESKGAWDLYRKIGTIPADQAFSSLNEGGCPFIRYN